MEDLASETMYCTCISHVQEACLEAIFYPGRFASSAISRTLELYGASEVEKEQLPTVTTIKVEAEVNVQCTYIVH